MTAIEFTEKTKQTIQDIIPESYCYCKFTNNLYPLVTLRFAKSKQWENNIIQNDPYFMLLFVEGFNKDGQADKVKLEVRCNNYHRTLPLRGKTATPQNIIEHIKKYLTNI